MINYVIDRLQDSAGLTAIVDPGDIYPLYRLQQSTVPAIVVQLTGTDPIDTHDAESTQEVHTVEVTVIHTNPKSAWDAAVLVRAQLDGWQTIGPVLFGRFVNQATDIFTATDFFSVTQRYDIHFERE